MRKFELRSDDMKIAKKNVADIWEDRKPDEKSSDVKCEGCNVMCEDMFLTATLPQRRTKHARTGLAGTRRMQVP